MIEKPSDHTYDLDSANFLHEERWDDVAWQHSQTAQETDQVDKHIIIVRRQLTAMFIVVKGGVLHPTVNELLPQVCRDQDSEE